MNTKEWILKNLFSNRVTISSRMQRRWFDVNSKSREYNEIINLTNFLPESSLLGQRIWHIINDKLEPLKCSNIYCGNFKYELIIN